MCVRAADSTTLPALFARAARRAASVEARRAELAMAHRAAAERAAEDRCAGQCNVIDVCARGRGCLEGVCVCGLCVRFSVFVCGACWR